MLKPIPNNHIGSRLKSFRENRNLTQQELELAIGASFGHISRIESGKVNPDKETISKISKALQLSNRELDYLIGVTIEPPSQKEIESAIAEVKRFFTQRGVLAYLLDERWRFHAFSDSFPKILGRSMDFFSDMFGHTTVEAAVNPQISINQYLTGKHHEELLSLHIPYYLAQTYFMSDDAFFQRTYKVVKTNAFALNIWEKYMQQEILGFNDSLHRIVYFNLGPFNLPMYFHREPLMVNSRFEVIEYKPTNQILKAIHDLHRNI